MTAHQITEVDSLVVARSHYVRVRSSDGLVGLGQSAAWAYPDAVDAVVREFREYLLGQDALRIERHWQHLYRMGPFRGSILSGALSAIDIALWDLKGQLLEVPIWQLLGGKYRERIRLCLILEPPASSVEDLATQALAALEEGFTAVKFDPLPDGYQDMTVAGLADTARARIEAVRSAVGSDADIVIELHRKLTPSQFHYVAEALAPSKPILIEDAIQIDSIQAQAELARRFNLPLATGERLNTVWEFRELLESGGPQFVRPDPGLAGGISQCRKIAAMAEAYHATVCFHCYFGPILTAATAHLDTTIPNFAIQEYSIHTNEAAFSDAFASAWKRDGGYLVVSEAPGLGVTLDESRAIGVWPPEWKLADTPNRQDGSVARAV